MSATTDTVPCTLETSLDLYPGFNRFALDFTRRSPSALRFLGPFDPISIRLPRPRRTSTELLEGLAKTNAEWGNDVATELQRWSRGETATLIAGQQVGFAGGPLYTLVKLASLLRLKDDLAARGIAATVFFWLATEDHDFEEISTIRVSTPHGIEMLRTGESSPPVPHVTGSLTIPESLRRQLLAITPPPAPPWLAAGINFRDSFARLLVSAIGSGSMVLVDSLLPQLRRDGKALLRRLLTQFDELQSLATSRSREIQEAGYQPQIEPGADGEYSFLYVVTSQGERKAIRHQKDSWFAGARKVSFDELQRMVEEQPESISTGALARPLLQDAVLAPEVFVGGPAEVAYYAQVRALHDHLGIDPPQVVLRAHAWVAPTKILRAVETYRLSTDELFLPVDELITRHETQAISKLRQLIDSSGTAIQEQLDQVRSFVVSFDPTMGRAIDHSLRKIRYQLQRVGEKGKRAIARRDAERHRAISRLSETLLPGGEPQDRVVGWIGYWLQYGAGLIERLVAEVEPDADRLKIVGL